MIARRGVIALTSTALAGLGMAALGTPAYADTTVIISGSLTYDVVAGVWSAPTFDPGSASGLTVTIDITGLTSANTDWDDESYVNGPLTLDGADCEVAETCQIDSRDAPAIFDVKPSASNSPVTLANDFFDVGRDRRTPISGSFAVTYAEQSEDSSGNSAAPSPLIQQFPVPATGTCDEAQPDGLNWGGVSSGGWSESWARWMHEGEGGFVCTRTLIYNASTSGWEVD